MSKPFEVGDRVAIVSFRTQLPMKLTTVVAVKKFKRRAKVTIENGDEYDQGGYPWSRTAWDTRPTIRHADESDTDAIEHEKNVSNVSAYDVSLIAAWR